MTIEVPEYSYLEKPHKVEGTPKESCDSFYELAKSRVRIVSQDEHRKFEKDIFGPDHELYCSAVYVIDRSDEIAEGQQER